MSTTKVLREQSGIQYQGVQDKSEADPRDSLINVVFFGQFKRGRVDRPFKVTKANYRSKLGNDPKNKDFQAVEDALNTGVPFVWVQRVAVSNNNGGSPSKPHYPISCEGASAYATLKGVSIISGFTKLITVDVYVNNVLVASDINATYINQAWHSNEKLQANASQLGYSVSGTSSNQEIFYNSSSSVITFSFVPKSDGVYGGQIYFAKDALQVDSSNSNSAIYKDPETGVLSFCLGLDK